MYARDKICVAPVVRAVFIFIFMAGLEILDVICKGMLFYRCIAEL